MEEASRALVLLLPADGGVAVVGSGARGGLRVGGIGFCGIAGEVYEAVVGSDVFAQVLAGEEGHWLL